MVATDVSSGASMAVLSRPLGQGHRMRIEPIMSPIKDNDLKFAVNTSLLQFDLSLLKLYLAFLQVDLLALTVELLDQ